LTRLSDEKKADSKDDEKIVGSWPVLNLFGAVCNCVFVLIALDDSDIQILKTYVCEAIHAKLPY
jgi:hypothetical protein